MKIVDDSHWPIVVTTLPESPQHDDLVALTEAHDRILDRGERYATITDLSFLRKPPGARERKISADWTNANSARIARLNVGSAVIVPNAILRGAMTAVNWIRRAPNGEVHVATMRDALEHVRKELEAAGIHIPSGVREHLKAHGAA